MADVLFDLSIEIGGSTTDLNFNLFFTIGSVSAGSMPKLLRDEYGEPILTDEKIGPTPVPIYLDYLPQAGIVYGEPFHAVEIEAFQPASVADIVWPISFGLVPWGIISLTPSQTAVTTIIRASDVGYRTRHTDLEVGGVRPYRAILAGSIPINREIDVDPKIVAASVSWGQIPLFNIDGRYDGIFSSYSVSARSAKIYRGVKAWDDTRGIWVDPRYADLELQFAGISEAWELDVNTLTVRVRDASFWLERPYQQNNYGGAGGYDGDAGLAGTKIPRTRGGTVLYPIQNVTPVLIDQINLIFQYNDARGSVVNLYEGAATVFTNDGDTTDLYTGSVAAGHYRTDNSRGLFQLGSVPVRAITADVTGEFPRAGAQTNWAGIAQFIITEDMGLSLDFIDLASFGRAQEDFPYIAGAYFAPGDNIDGVGAACRFIGAVGAKLIDGRDGRLRCFPLRALYKNQTSSLTISKANTSTLQPVQMPTALDPPPYRIRVAYNHNWTLLTGDFNGIATAARQQFVATTDTYSSFSDVSVVSAYAQPNDLPPFGGVLLVKDNADQVANDLGDLWCTKTFMYDVSLPMSVGIHLDIGSVVRLVWPMGTLRNGVIGQIIGERYQTQDPTVIFRVLVAGVVDVPVMHGSDGSPMGLLLALTVGSGGSGPVEGGGDGTAVGLLLLLTH